MITDQQVNDALLSLMNVLGSNLKRHTDIERDQLYSTIAFHLSHAYVAGRKATEDRLMPSVRRYEWQRDHAMKELQIEVAMNITDPQELKNIYEQYDAALDALIAGLNFSEAIAAAKSKPAKKCMQ